MLNLANISLSNQMKLTLLPTLVLFLNSCGTPFQPGQGYHQSDISPEERSRNRALVNQVEDESFRFDQRERMGQARAIETATRNAPRSITNQSTNLFVW
jgi:hypothetical protein